MKAGKPIDLKLPSNSRTPNNPPAVFSWPTLLQHFGSLNLLQGAGSVSVHALGGNGSGLGLVLGNECIQLTVILWQLQLHPHIMHQRLCQACTFHTVFLWHSKPRWHNDNIRKKSTLCVFVFDKGGCIVNKEQQGLFGWAHTPIRMNATTATGNHHLESVLCLWSCCLSWRRVTVVMHQ